MSQERALADVRRAAKQRDRATEKLEGTLDELGEALQRAVDAGVPVAALAREAGISRQHVYNLLRRGGG